MHIGACTSRVMMLLIMWATPNNSRKELVTLVSIERLNGSTRSKLEVPCGNNLSGCRRRFVAVEAQGVLLLGYDSCPPSNYELLCGDYCQLP